VCGSVGLGVDVSEASPPRLRPKPPQNPSLSPSLSKIAGDASADEMAKLRRASGASKLRRACNASCASGGSKADEEETSRREGQRRSTNSSSTSSPESRRCMPHHVCPKCGLRGGQTWSEREPCVAQEGVKVGPIGAQMRFKRVSFFGENDSCNTRIHNSLRTDPLVCNHFLYIFQPQTVRLAVVSLKGDP
jgi:hypothetical protein